MLEHRLNVDVIEESPRVSLSLLGADTSGQTLLPATENDAGMCSRCRVSNALSLSGNAAVVLRDMLRRSGQALEAYENAR